MKKIKSIKAEKAKLKRAVDMFANEMLARLFEKAEVHGYSGWDGDYDGQKLAIELNKDSIRLVNGHHKAKKSVDIANRAMMLWWRAWGEYATPTDQTDKQAESEQAAMDMEMEDQTEADKYLDKKVMDMKSVKMKRVTEQTEGQQMVEGFDLMEEEGEV